MLQWFVPRSVAINALAGNYIIESELLSTHQVHDLSDGVLDSRANVTLLKEYFAVEAWKSIRSISKSLIHDLIYQCSTSAYMLIKVFVIIALIDKAGTYVSEVSYSCSVQEKRTANSWKCDKCGVPDDGTLKMICCDLCLQWFHW